MVIDSLARRITACIVVWPQLLMQSLFSNNTVSQVKPSLLKVVKPFNCLVLKVVKPSVYSHQGHITCIIQKLPHKTSVPTSPETMEGMLGSLERKFIWQVKMNLNGMIVLLGISKKVPQKLKMEALTYLRLGDELLKKANFRIFKVFVKKLHADQIPVEELLKATEILEPFPFEDQTDMSVGGALHDFIDVFLTCSLSSKVNKLKDDKQSIYSDASKAENTKEGKLGVEQDLRKLRAEHEQRRKSGVGAGS
ncbi:beta-amylase [Artemisia annua]|uniref:Beta-amylase n=1 Tax=Artemisia annua TaxID=35608 RepID=A0A2U1NP27_ARTAN|nr:beta-amylase [Artemisia annua]